MQTKQFYTTTYLIVFFLLQCLFINCKKKTDNENGTVHFKVQAFVDGEMFDPTMTYTNDAGLDYRVEICEFYLSNIELHNDLGETTVLTDVLFYDLLTDEGFNFEIAAGNYTNITIGIGLDEQLNAADPSIFEGNHPLSYTNNRYWSWAAKYIFLALEGRTTDSAQNPAEESGFLYHVGADDFYQTISLPKNINVTEKETTDVILNLDINKVLYRQDQPLNMITEPITHTSNKPELASDLFTSFVKAFN